MSRSEDVSGIVMRRAVDADLADVLALYAQPGVDDGAMLGLSAARDILARFARYPDYRLYVAEIDGCVIGSYALLIMDNLGHQGAPSAIVEGVMVAPDRHGRGVGSAMMHHAMAEASLSGCYKLVLSSNLKRERAHAFYEGLGFEQHGLSFRVPLRDEQTTFGAAP